MSALPATLRSAVQRLLEGQSRRALAARAEVTSAGYRTGRGSAGLIRDEADVAAYLTVRMPATYAAIAAALREVEAMMPRFAPRSLLDVACGPGTASFACVETWPSVEQVTMIDTNERFLAAARQLTAAADAAALRAVDIARGRLELAAVPLPQADLVVMGYALVELAATDLPEVAARLWERCTGMLVLVEPGSRDGFERLRRCRDLLLKAGARIVAPCPHEADCPMAGKDWCHFSQRLPRLRDHMIAKAARVPFEDEKFSYLAVSREPVSGRPAAARVLGSPKVSKVRWSGRVCIDGNLRSLEVERRDPRYRSLAKKHWGDAIGSADLEQVV